jgi:nucleolar protein 6
MMLSRAGALAMDPGHRPAELREKVTEEASTLSSTFPHFCANMSKTKEHAPKADKTEKKRKRQEETDDAPKKSKKSRKSDVDQDATAAGEPVVEQTPVDKKAEKEAKKKAKKEKKEKAAAEAGDVKESEDFVPLDNDAPMPDATDDSTAKADKKKSKKDKSEKKEKNEKKEKKEKKDKKSKDVPEADTTEEQNGIAEEDVPATNGAEAEAKLSKEEKKAAKKEKKEKKEKKSKKSKKDEASTEETEPAAETNGDAAGADESAEAGAEEDGDESAEPGKKGRFICFVGMF